MLIRLFATALIVLAVALAPTPAHAKKCKPFAPHTCVKNKKVKELLTPPEIRHTRDVHKEHKKFAKRNQDHLKELATPPEVRHTRDLNKEHRKFAKRNQDHLKELATPVEVRHNRDIFNGNREFAERNRYNNRSADRRSNQDLYGKYKGVAQDGRQQFGIEQSQAVAQQQAQQSIAALEARDASAAIAGGGRPILGSGAGSVLPGVSGRSVTYVENGNVTVIGPQGDVQFSNGRAAQ